VSKEHEELNVSVADAGDSGSCLHPVIRGSQMLPLCAFLW